MKIAISGKGGVGKSTIAAALALHFAKKRAQGFGARPGPGL